MATPSGRVYLCANAIVDRSYNHTIDFKSPSEQQAYWGSLVKYSKAEGDYTYIRRQRPYIAVEYNLDQLQDVNYLFYTAKENSKTYYCWVDSKEYINEYTTHIYFTVDVLQTYMFDYKIKQSYVVQEHCDRWDADHKPIYSRTDEGLDYGAEYTIESAYRVKPGSEELKPYSWYLAICVDHNTIVESGTNGKEPTQVDGIANPYIYYLLPYKEQDIGKTLPFIVNGEQVGIGTITTFSNTMADGEALGNYVKQIIKLPYLPCHMTYIESEGKFNTANESFIFGTATIKGTPYLRIESVRSSALHRILAEMNIFEGIDSAMPTAEQWAEIKANPYTTERDKRFESKLLTHPYRYNILSDWKNQPAIIKNEYIGNDKIRLHCLQGITFNSPARYWIEDYKKDPEGRHTSLLQAIQEDNPVITDEYYSYMLQNRNQIQADRTNAIVSGATSVVKGAVGGAIFGGIGGAISGAVSSGVDSAINYQNMVRSQNAIQKDLKNLPDTINSSNDCAFSIQDNNTAVTFYRMKICCEFEELLADTFNMTGYTVKRVKVPNLKTRTRFNYVKTIGANIVGSFDQSDLEQIKRIFDNGVTFWHWNAEHFHPFDYSYENIETKLI